MDALRREADTAIERAELAEAKLKEMETLVQNHDNEVKSLKNKITLLEDDLDRAEERILKQKADAESANSAGRDVESMQRKISLLEGDLDTAEEQLHVAQDKVLNLLKPN